MDNRRDKDKEFDRAQAMDRLTQDDKDKMSLIKMMMDKEKKSMKERKAIPSDRAMDKAIDKDEKIRDMKEEEFIDYSLDPYDDKEEVEGMIIKFVVAKRGVDADIAKSFIDTHYEDIIDAENTDDILDEFDEFMSVNTEYVSEADSIPTEPGTDKKASNHDRKMALRSAIDILKAELGVETDDALKYVTTHRDELLDGTVDPYNKDEVIDDYGEYLSVNTEYVREEDGENLNPGNPPANFKSPNEEGDEAVGRESASGAFEEAINWRGETLKEQFKRLLK